MKKHKSKEAAREEVKGHVTLRPRLPLVLQGMDQHRSHTLTGSEFRDVMLWTGSSRAASYILDLVHEVGQRKTVTKLSLMLQNKSKLRMMQLINRLLHPSV